MTIKDTDEASGNVLGGAAGGVAGGVAGSTIGGGKGQTLATIGGAIAGAVAGAMLEDQLSTQSGIEYIVQLDGAQRSNKDVFRKEESIKVNKGTTVKDDVNASIDVAETESELLSIVQSDDAPLTVGQRVLVVYSDDRPRVVPDMSR